MSDEKCLYVKETLKLTRDNFSDNFILPAMKEMGSIIKISDALFCRDVQLPNNLRANSSLIGCKDVVRRRVQQL